MSNLYLIHMVSKVIIIKNFSIDCILIMYRTHPKLVIGKQRSNIIDSCHIQAINKTTLLKEAENSLLADDIPSE